MKRENVFNLQTDAYIKETPKKSDREQSVTAIKKIRGLANSSVLKGLPSICETLSSIPNQHCKRRKFRKGAGNIMNTKKQKQSYVEIQPFINTVGENVFAVKSKNIK